MKRLYNAIPVKNYKSLGTVFETTSGLYVYDTGTGKVFSCNEVTYNLFKIIFSGGDTNEIYEKLSTLIVLILRVRQAWITNQYLK